MISGLDFAIINVLIDAMGAIMALCLIRNNSPFRAHRYICVYFILSILLEALGYNSITMQAAVQLDSATAHSMAVDLMLLFWLASDRKRYCSKDARRDD